MPKRKADDVYDEERNEILTQFEKGGAPDADTVKAAFLGQRGTTAMQALRALMIAMQEEGPTFEQVYIPAPPIRRDHSKQLKNGWKYQKRKWIKGIDDDERFDELGWPKKETYAGFRGCTIAVHRNRNLFAKVRLTCAVDFNKDMQLRLQIEHKDVLLDNRPAQWTKTFNRREFYNAKDPKGVCPVFNEFNIEQSKDPVANLPYLQRLFSQFGEDRTFLVNMDISGGVRYNSEDVGKFVCKCLLPTDSSTAASFVDCALKQ